MDSPQIPPQPYINGRQGDREHATKSDALSPRIEKSFPVLFYNYGKTVVP
jgi:hypothetical protein